MLVFTESAAWYDRFQAGKDYAREARQVTSLIRRHQPAARTLLDVACGTGRHLCHFRETFTCHGLDLDGGLLDVARNRLPDVPFTRADMTAFDLGQRFDAVTCLFSSIGYVGTTERLHAAVGVMARHLSPGGVLIIEPWILPERWPEFDGQSHADTIFDGQSTLVRVRTNRRSGTTTELLVHYVAAGRGQITTADETHRLRMFTRAEYLDAVTGAGLHPEWDPDGITGRGLLVATHPAPGHHKATDL